jgi:putative transposase
MLPPVVSALIACLVSLLRSRLSLCVENLALRHQLAVYKQTSPRPRLRPADRLFWVWLSRLWPRCHQALGFVQPRTVIAWQRQRFRDHWRRLSQQGKSGRPTIVKEVRELIRMMWQANPTWGSPRIVGELRKLGIDVAKSTVEKYRPRSRKSPSPTGFVAKLGFGGKIRHLDFGKSIVCEHKLSCFWYNWLRVLPIGLTA